MFITNMRKIHIGEKKASLTAVLGKLGVRAKGTELDPHLSHCTKINTKLSKAFIYISPGTPTLSEQNTGMVCQDRGMGKDFLRRTGAAQETKSRTDK